MAAARKGCSGELMVQERANDMVGYSFAIVLAFVCWLVTLGLTCFKIKLRSGIWLNLHGLVCWCDEDNDFPDEQ